MLTLEVHRELSQIVEIGLGTSLTEGPTFTFHADLNDEHVCFNNKSKYCDDSSNRLGVY